MRERVKITVWVYVAAGHERKRRTPATQFVDRDAPSIPWSVVTQRSATVLVFGA